MSSSQSPVSDTAPEAQSRRNPGRRQQQAHGASGRRKADRNRCTGRAPAGRVRPGRGQVRPDHRVQPLGQLGQLGRVDQQPVRAELGRVPPRLGQLVLVPQVGPGQPELLVQLDGGQGLRARTGRRACPRPGRPGSRWPPPATAAPGRRRPPRPAPRSRASPAAAGASCSWTARRRPRRRTRSPSAGRPPAGATAARRAAGGRARSAGGRR